jgi:hypothetical protein
MIIFKELLLFLLIEWVNPCMTSDTGFSFPMLIGTESAGDFIDESSAESIAVTNDSRYIAIGFTHTDTSIVGTGTSPKGIALFDTSMKKWLFTVGINNQHPDYTCQVYFNAKQDHVLAQYSFKQGQEIYPSFAFFTFDGSTDGDVKLVIQGANSKAPYNIQPSGVITDWANSIYVAINYTINETIPGANVDGDRKLAVCKLVWTTGAPPNIDVCHYYSV